MDDIFKTITKKIRLMTVLALSAAFTPCYCYAAETDTDSITHTGNAIFVDSLKVNEHLAKTSITAADTATVKKKKLKQKRDWSTWTPSPKKATLLAMVIPGGGQIYNRKYWKLPFVYGGFLGCGYAIRWNNMMYKDYSSAYMDLMDDDPATDSYKQFLPLGGEINESNRNTYENMFKRRKDYYRKYRDLSIFCIIGVYALSVIDAYVDASLSEFDISKDLSMRIEPAVINSRTSNNPLKSSSLGLQCSLNF